MVGLSLPVKDLTHLPVEERLAVAEQRMMGMLREPFALESGPLYRVRLFRLDAVDHLFLFLTHHIVFDGWSETLFVNELCALYGSFCSGGVGELPALPIQYADFAHWQRTEAQGETLRAQLAYWREKLGGELPVLDLPTDRARPPSQTYTGATRSLVLPASLVGQLEALGRQEGVTLFMALLATFKVLLHRYTGQTDIVVGTMVRVAARPRRKS